MFCLKKLVLIMFIMLLLCVSAQALPSYEMNWWTIDSGGGTSSGGSYEISGTIAQSDAGVEMTGGAYSLSGGFWSGVGPDSSDVWMLY